MDTYRCTHCGETKTLTEFSQNRRMTKGHDSWCKACKRTYMAQHRSKHPERRKEAARKFYQTNRDKVLRWNKEWRDKCPDYMSESHLTRRYGLPPGTYAAMLTAQDGKCAICGTTEPNWRKARRFHMDHDATTGQVRGLLCHRCNTGIGLLGHDPELLQAAIRYLNQTSG